MGPVYCQDAVQMVDFMLKQLGPVAFDVDFMAFPP